MFDRSLTGIVCMHVNCSIAVTFFSYSYSFVVCVSGKYHKLFAQPDVSSALKHENEREKQIKK